MKSLGLALTIFSLTGALAVLDMSGAHRVATSNPVVVKTDPTRLKHMVASPNAYSNYVKAKNEADGAVIDAFLVLPRATPQVGRKIVVELRYD